MKFKNIVILCIIVLICSVFVAYYFLKISEKVSVQKNRQNLNEVAVKQISDLLLTDKWCFAVFGEKGEGDEVFKDALALVGNDSEIQFIINNGGFVSQGYTYQYLDYTNMIKSLNKPILTVLGRADVKHNGLLNYKKFFGNEYYDFNVGNSAFIILNMSSDNGSSFTAEQDDWLIKVLDKYQNSKFRFVFLNIPLFDAGVFDFDPLKNIGRLSDVAINSSYGLRNKDLAVKLAGLFSEKKVSYVFTSNINAFFEGEWSGVPFITTGGAGKPFRGIYGDAEFNHYIKTCIDGEKVKSEVVLIQTQK